MDSFVALHVASSRVLEQCLVTAPTKFYSTHVLQPIPTIPSMPFSFVIGDPFCYVQHTTHAYDHEDLLSNRCTVGQSICGAWTSPIMIPVK